MKSKTPKCKTNAQFSICRNCNHCVTAHFRGIEWEICNKLFHAKCQRISNTEYVSIENQFWSRLFCCENDKNDINLSNETKSFLRHVDDIVRTVKGDTKELSEAVNNLHRNHQYKIETTDDKNSLPLLGMSINVQPEGTILRNFGKILELNPIPKITAIKSLVINSDSKASFEFLWKIRNGGTS